jgi:hypothetical protein
LGIILFIQASENLGDISAYFIADASGIADVGSVTRSAAQMSKEGLEFIVTAPATFIPDCRRCWKGSMSHN